MLALGESREHSGEAASRSEIDLPGRQEELIARIIGLGALFLDVATSTSFINFGAFTAFTLVNLSVIGYFMRHRQTEAGSGLNPATYVVVPLIGALVDVYLLTKLDSAALILGASWLAIGVVYLLVLTHGLRVPPPEMSLVEDDTTRSRQGPASTQE